MVSDQVWTRVGASSTSELTTLLALTFLDTEKRPARALGAGASGYPKTSGISPLGRKGPRLLPIPHVRKFSKFSLRGATLLRLAGRTSDMHGGQNISKKEIFRNILPSTEVPRQTRNSASCETVPRTATQQPRALPSSQLLPTCRR
jgi:hypothetical protein